MTARVLVTNNAYVAAEMVRHWLAAVPLLAVGRVALLWSEGKARRLGEAGQPTLIVGAGRIGRLTARRLLLEPEVGLRPVAFVDDDPLPAEDDLTTSLPVIGLHEVERELEDADISQIVVTYSRATHEELLELSRSSMSAGVTVSVVPRLFELDGERAAIDYLGGVPLVELHQSDPYGWRYSAKYGFDRVAAVVGLLLCLPLFVGGTLA